MRRLLISFGIIMAIAAISAWALLTPIDLPWIEGRLVRPDLKLGLDLRGGTHLVLEADLSKLGPDESAEDAMAGVVDILQRRVDAYGVTEPIIQRQPGGNRLLVQLPGVKDVNQAVRLIGQTAQMEFKEQELDEQGNPAVDEQGRPKWTPTKATLQGQETPLTGKYLKRRNFVGLNPQTNEPQVNFEWDVDGAQLFEQITTRLVGKPLGIFLDGELISSPIVRDVIKERGIITGVTLEEARLLAIQLNAGALPVPLKIIQQQDVDAFLGADSLQKSLRAGVVGLILVVLFILLYYRWLGLVADLSLLYYGVLLLALFKLIPVTLTLSGIAGFIISLGMAVDANVLIFERMKEELRAGRTLQAATDLGFSRAWAAIWDSNITTLIVCVIIYWFGSRFGAAPLMGFALTLGIGIVVSMFTAVTVSRSLLRFSYLFPVTRRLVQRVG